MLNLTYVQTFVAILEEGGFQQAAQRLKRAQPTISLQLQKLEEELGVALIARSRTQCTATPAGERFYPYARSLLRLEGQARNSAKHALISVGASSNIGIYVLQPYVKRFMDKAESRNSLELTIASNPVVVGKLERGEIDVALMEWWDSRPGFSARIWRHEPMVVIVPPFHPWANHSAIAKQKLTEEVWVGGEPGTGTGTLMRKVFGSLLRKLRIAVSVGSTEAVKEAVKAGVGISLVLEAAVREEVQCGSLKALPIKGISLEKEIWIIHPEASASNPLLSKFVSELATPVT